MSGKSARELHTINPSCTKFQGQLRDKPLRPFPITGSQVAAAATTASAGRLLENRLQPTHQRRFKDSAQEWRAAENADADRMIATTPDA